MAGALGLGAFVSGAAPALLFGVAVGNVMQGAPFRLTDDLHSIYEGGALWKLLALLDPFALLAGVVSLAMLTMHGAAWLTLKIEDGAVRDRARAIGAALTVRGLRAGREVSTLLFSKMAILGVIASVGLTMFPFILPSSIDPRSSLTVWDSSSSHLTLFVMLISTAIFLPLILLYTAWVYRVLWGKVTERDVVENGHALY